jgi:hypothetical protein
MQTHILVGHAASLLVGILRRDHEPHLGGKTTPEHLARKGKMSVMDGVETAAENSHTPFIHSEIY